MATVFQCALEADLMPHNPFAEVSLDGLALKGTAAQHAKAGKSARLPFSSAQLEQYFSGPLFAGPGFHVDLPASVAYWFPLMLRLTGARPVEISYLMRDDIAQHDNSTWLYIFRDDVRAPDGTARRTKHDVSVRRVPLPQVLLDLGFMDYVSSVSHGQWLFPLEVPNVEEPNRPTYTLEALGDYRRITLGITDRRVVTYSFRHNIVDELRAAGIEAGTRDAFVGHAQGNAFDKNSGEIYYGHRWYPAAPLVDAVQRLFPTNPLPAGFPSWDEFVNASPDFHGVDRPPRATRRAR